MDFTYADFRSSITRYREAGYAVSGFTDFLTCPQPKHLIIRHDVDLSLDAALRMARLEHHMGMSTSYFLRVHAQGYSVTSFDSMRKIEELAQLGHDVELHLDGGLHGTLASGEKETIDRQRTILEAVLGRSIQGFSVHEPARMGGIKEADATMDRWGVSYHSYEPRFTQAPAKYLSDSGARWREGHFRDWVDRVDHIQVLIHPFWWFDQLPQENY